jgi:hypothetical protein
MSTLQISLAIAGAAVLAVVVAHGAWTSRKNRPRQATQPTPSSVEGTGDASVDMDPLARQEPEFDGSLEALTTLTSIEKKASLDGLIDVIAPIAIDSQVSGEAALAAMPATRRVGSKPFAVEGLSIETGEWEMPAAGQRYSAFQAGVQLANRTGALNQIEYSEFVMKAQAFADAVNGEPEFKEMHEEVARARELDQFASEHDAQLSFTLRAATIAWSPGYVQQNAARHGFVAGAIPGRMVLPGAQAQAPILVLSFDSQAAMADDPEQTALRELTMSLDVPQVSRSEKPFELMCKAALALASAMDGALMDDNGNRIRAESMQVINADLEKLYDTLDARELSAGSPLGRRLFS